MDSQCSQHSRTTAGGPGGSVVVAADAPHMRSFIRAGLERHGYSVHVTEVESAAARVAVRPQPGLIVLDLGQHGGGADVLQALCSSSNAPVIVLSDEIDEARKARYLEMGAADHLVKPIGIGELAARCKTASRTKLENLQES